MTTIVLSGEPKSTNHIYKFTCMRNFPSMYMTKEGKDIKEAYQWEAKSQWKQKPIKDPVNISIELFFGKLGKRDIDNYGKLLLDALTGIVWEDDSQIQKMTIAKWYDKLDPRIEITIL